MFIVQKRKNKLSIIIIIIIILGICVAVFGEPEYFGEGSGQAIAVVSPTYHLTEFSALFYL